MEINRQIQNLIDELMDDRNSQDLVGLIDKTKKLAGLSYTMATFVGDYAQAKNDAEFLYKSSVNRFIQRGTGAKNKLEVDAKIEYEELEKTWIQAENSYQKFKLKLAQINAILDQMRQTISYLKEEKKNEV